MQTLILGSSSPARKTLLERLKIDFQIIAPDIDETPRPNETPQHLVERLAMEKAFAVAHKKPDALIIACDQVITVDQQILGKPKDYDDAVHQLKLCNGQQVISLTALCLLNAKTNNLQKIIERFDVYFRDLTDEMIANYLRLDQPFHCAGSIKAEALGVALFEKMSGDDPNALLGLPLIQLIKMLEKENIKIL